MTGPLYRQVEAAVLARITGGEYGPGALLPSEEALGAELGVSQGTARKALAGLEARGIVRRRQGAGTFVTLRTPSESLFHFFRLRDGAGAQVVPELLSEEVSRRAATAEERAALTGAPDEVFQIVRVRGDGAPLCREISVVPVALFPDLDGRGTLPNTMYVLFQQAYGCVVVRAEDGLSAVGLDAPGAAALGTVEGAPVLKGRRRAFDLAERCVEMRESWYLTDRAEYRVTLA